MTRITLARLVFLGASFKIYPPPFPFLLCRIFAFFNSLRIFSRNFSGIFLSEEILHIRTGPLPYSSARWVSAWNAYRVFLDSICYYAAAINVFWRHYANL